MSLSELDTDNTRIEESHHPTMDDLVGAVSAKLQSQGWCLVRPVDTSPDRLLTIAKQFGTIQRHIRADANGLVGKNMSVDQGWKDYQSEYIGVNQDRMNPHTDGSFLAGAMEIDGCLHPVDPPAMMLLQCTHPAHSGGQHLVVDGQAIVERLMEADPAMVRTLMTPGCMTVCRDDQISREVPVLSPSPDHTLRLRFRYDSKTYAPAESLSALRAFRDLTCDPDLLHSFDQVPGEILVLDNHRALHGREAFENHPDHPPRSLRRVWIREHRESPLLGVENQQTQQRVLDGFASYGPIESMNALDRSPVIRTGIQLAQVPRLSD
jgi:alpha-ketoglutarate-dependent taurine dioxygenase